MHLSPLLLLPLPAHTASILCAPPLYGTPLLPDATALANSLPYAKSDPHHETDSPRIFAEPAFFTPNFQAQHNPWATAMVQLPRVWRNRSARIALLFYADAAGHVPAPSITATWRGPRAAAAGLLQYCIQGQQGAGGVWILSDPAQTPYLALYLYAAGSPFETVLNAYMSTGRGVNPFDPRGLGAEGVAVNASGLLGALEERAVLGVGGRRGVGDGEGE